MAHDFGNGIFGVVYRYVWPDGMKYIGQRSAGPLEGYPTHSKPVQERIAKEGMDGISVSVLCRCSCKQSLDCSEVVYQLANDVLRDPNYYNKHIHNIGWSTAGDTPSDATREKISKSNKGRPKSPEHRRKIGESNKGRPCPPAVIQNTIERNRTGAVWRGRKHRPESIDKMKEYHNQPEVLEARSQSASAQHANPWMHYRMLAGVRAKQRCVRISISGVISDHVSVYDCARHTGIPRPSLSHHLNGHQPLSAKYNVDFLIFTDI